MGYILRKKGTEIRFKLSMLSVCSKKGIVIMKLFYVQYRIKQTNEHINIIRN